MRSKGVNAMEPVLRFPAFSGAWKATRIGEIADLYKGKNIAKADIRSDGDHPCIRYGELYTVYNEVITDVISRTSLPLESLFFSEQNDVIIPSSGETKEDIATASCVIPGGIALGGDLNVLRTRENGVFLSYCLNGPLRTRVARVAQGDSVVHLYPHQIEKLPISIPSRDEQKRIADCLVSIDASIEAESRKLDALKAYKQSLMQQLFPAEGERMPRLRFPGFDGKWKLQKLDDTIVTVTPPAKLQTSQYMQQGAYPIIDQSPQPIAAWTDDAGGLIAGPFPLIVFGDHTCVLKLAENPFVQGADGIKIFHVEKDVSTAFLFQCLQVNPVLMLDYRRHFSQLKEKMVSFPEDPKEQSRIVDLLASLDALVRAQVEMIGALAQHKKGLMQGLFPAMDAGAA